ncbi:MAG: septum formation inhibitor Maf [Clostridia bacterium]|nr:septum formation inhibitor Maf [Clostridia bacterium]
MQSIILASQSPRRKELLSLYGLPFVVDPSQADEEHATGTGAERVKKLAQDKCREVAQRHPGEMVLAADTLVCVGDEILGKPKDEADACRMLRLLSGNAHQVHTGMCLLLPDGREMLGVDTAQVHFMPLSDEMISRYVSTGEPMDKAGAYAIQGMAGVFITHIEGSPSNVIGLPLGLLTQFFMEAGVEFFPPKP